MNDPRTRLIAALDVADRKAALAAVDRLSGHVGCFKIGLELFTREGPRLVEEIRDRGEKIFLDLKLHDIPNTVAGAVRSVCMLGVDMVTVHASGGAAMLEAACREARSSGSSPLVLAVTALTSLSERDMGRFGIGGSIEEWVERLAWTACNAGIRGLVASAKEISMLRGKMDPNLQLVIPGIRPAGSDAQDQARTATPYEAMRAGANYLVVGRPILKADDPAAAADSIAGEIARALRESSLRNP
ncbi:MAG: orotidine-5'-phosphate decarboxylase [Acidobacteria bacterium]|nr:orotidine-5'-phosphate decarboxylase [Acidobacteriota bacterium]